MVTTEQGNKLCMDNSFAKYVECSALTRENLPEVFFRAV